MEKELRILMLEDAATDAELIERELRRANIKFCATRVETKEAFVNELEHHVPDLILSDFTLPSFDGLSALAIARERCPDVPFIFVSRTLGEELAIETLKSGAIDYVLKERLSRLAPSLRRALREAKERTERKRAEAALRESEQRLQTLVERLPEGVLLLDGQRRLVLANPAALSYLPQLTSAGVGDVLTQLAGFPIEHFIAPASQGEWHELMADGKQARIFEVSARELETAQDSKGCILVLRDITHERELQQRSQQQERLAAVGQLAAGIAHDFNNLLTGIIGFAELLRRRKDMPAAAREHLARIVKQGERAAHLIRQVLDFSRKSISQPHPLDLSPFLKEAAKFLQRTIPENIQILLDMNPGQHLVKADPTQIQQVLTNLAVNARDAMPKGGVLRFRLSQLTLEPGERPPCPGMHPGQWIAFYVSDTGTGIPGEILPHIFEPFFTTKGPGQGTGLGLAQVYGIIQQHDGFIDVISRPGKGTMFIIYLPALAIPEEEPSDDGLEGLLLGNGETVLLVEDEPEVLEAGKAILEHLGYSVVTATNGRQALKVYAEHKDEIALVLTDMVMPEMDGVALFQALRAGNPDIQLVVMTGYPLGDEAKELLAQGVVDWLQKPVNFIRLAQVVGRILGSKT